MILDELAELTRIRITSDKEKISPEELHRLAVQKAEEEGKADFSFEAAGSDIYLKEIAGKVKIPVLRKDFTVDTYMIDQAKVLGASAVLLIAAILSDKDLAEYFSYADRLGLSCIFEAHDAEEVERCLRAGARILGVNNRNLKDFSVDMGTSLRLRSMVPSDVIYISESGIATPDDVRILYENGTDAVLVGEMLMRSSDKTGLIAEMKRR